MPALCSMLLATHYALKLSWHNQPGPTNIDENLPISKDKIKTLATTKLDKCIQIHLK